MYNFRRQEELVGGSMRVCVKEPGSGLEGGLLGGGNCETDLRRCEQRCPLPEKGRRSFLDGREAICQCLGARGLLQHLMNYSEASLAGAERTQWRRAD